MKVERGYMHMWLVYQRISLYAEMQLFDNIFENLWCYTAYTTFAKVLLSAL